MVRSFLPKFSSKSEKRLLALCKNNQENDPDIKKWNKVAVQYLVKKIGKRFDIIDELERAISQECSTTKCVPIPKKTDNRLLVSHRRGLPQVVYCRLWRWPDLQSHHQIRPIPNCQIAILSEQQQQQQQHHHPSPSSSTSNDPSKTNPLSANPNSSTNNSNINNNINNNKNSYNNNSPQPTTSSTYHHHIHGHKHCQGLISDTICVNPFHYERKKVSPLEPVLVPISKIPPDFSTSFEDSDPTGGSRPAGAANTPNRIFKNLPSTITGATVRSLLSANSPLLTRPNPAGAPTTTSGPTLPTPQQYQPQYPQPSQQPPPPQPPQDQQQQQPQPRQPSPTQLPSQAQSQPQPRQSLSQTPQQQAQSQQSQQHQQSPNMNPHHHHHQSPHKHPQQSHHQQQEPTQHSPGGQMFRQTSQTELAQPFQFKQNRFSQMARAMHEHRDLGVQQRQQQQIQSQHQFDQHGFSVQSFAGPTQPAQQQYQSQTLYQTAQQEPQQQYIQHDHQYEIQSSEQFTPETQTYTTSHEAQEMQYQPEQQSHIQQMQMEYHDISGINPTMQQEVIGQQQQQTQYQVTSSVSPQTYATATPAFSTQSYPMGPPEEIQYQDVSMQGLMGPPQQYVQSQHGSEHYQPTLSPYSTAGQTYSSADQYTQMPPPQTPIEYQDIPMGMQSSTGTYYDPIVGTGQQVLHHHHHPEMDEPQEYHLQPLDLPQEIHSEHHLPSDPLPPQPVQSQEPISLDFQEVPYVEGKYWCSMSYHEYDVRVGEKYSPQSMVCSVDGYTHPACKDRFCVGGLSNVNRNHNTEWVRRRIGKGVRLTYVDQEVYVECLSDSSVFVSSPMLGLEEGREDSDKIIKLNHRGSVRVFSNAQFSKLLSTAVTRGFEAVYKLTQYCTFRTSFVKGWGRSYKRQTILNTPCWVEVQLNGPLQWIDKVLRQMRPPQGCGSTS